MLGIFRGGGHTGATHKTRLIGRSHANTAARPLTLL